MANEAISQMPAAATLTGTELIEVVQSGVNVRSTVANIVASASITQASLQGASSQTPAQFAAAGNFATQLIWMTGVPELTGGGAPGGATNQGIGVGWQNLGGTFSAQQPTGTGANLAATVGTGILTSSSAANSMASANATVFNSAGACMNMVRAYSNGLPVAGFTMTFYFTLRTIQAGGAIFFGLAPGTEGFSATQVPSALLNTVGLGMDQSDTNLSFYINNGSGSATKSSLGVTPANLQNQLLRLVITCDGLGNVAFALTNLEATGTYAGQSWTLSYATSTAKLPATNTLIEPQLYMNNGGTAVAVAFGFVYFFATCGFGGA
jgi:hypothetical protein